MRGRSEYVDIETMFSHVLPALRLLSRAVCWCGSKQSSFGGAGSERINTNSKSENAGALRNREHLTSRTRSSNQQQLPPPDLELYAFLGLFAVGNHLLQNHLKARNSWTGQNLTAVYNGTD